MNYLKVKRDVFGYRYRWEHNEMEKLINVNELQLLLCNTQQGRQYWGLGCHDPQVLRWRESWGLDEILLYPIM